MRTKLPMLEIEYYHPECVGEDCEDLGWISERMSINVDLIESFYGSNWPEEFPATAEEQRNGATLIIMASGKEYIIKGTPAHLEERIRTTLDPGIHPEYDQSDYSFPIGDPITVKVSNKNRQQDPSYEYVVRSHIEDIRDDQETM